LLLTYRLIQHFKKVQLFWKVRTFSHWCRAVNTITPKCTRASYWSPVSDNKATAGPYINESQRFGSDDTSGENATFGSELEAWSGIIPTIHRTYLYGQITIQFAVDCNTRTCAVRPRLALSRNLTCRITEQSRPRELFWDLAKRPFSISVGRP
jgi:hypothetical protein